MNFRVTLWNSGYSEELDDGTIDERPCQETVVVSEVHYHPVGDYYVALSGAHPAAFPDMADDQDAIGETRSWLSKGPTFYLSEEDDLEILNVSPTDDPISKPDLGP